MHTKMFLFSAVGDARRVLTVTTTNLAPGQTKAWNDSVTLVGNRPLYAAAVEYFDKLALDRPTTDFTKIATSPKYRLYLFPYPRKQGVRDYFTTSLGAIDCRVPRKARAGKDGRTVVRLRTTIWRDDRIDVAKRLVALHRAGCKVRATINLELTDPGVKATLYNGGVVTRYQSRAAGDVISHGKTIIVSGVQRRETVNTVHTGSTNPSRVAERRNDNAMIQVRNDRAMTEKFLENFVVVWKQSRPLTKTQVVTARPIPARVRG